MSNTLQVQPEAPRSAVLCARILWTYSAAFRRFGSPEYLEMAHWAYDYLCGAFWDPLHGGLYWTLDAEGQPLNERKHHYAQAFGIYGLSEYYRAVQAPESLVLAQELLRLLEQHAFDTQFGGYLEGSSRAWGPLADSRLGDADPNYPKSMNTMLHIIEAYTNLLRVWDAQELRTRQRQNVLDFLTHIYNSATGHLNLFFNERWASQSEQVSYGHDIEASWLLWEAASMLDDSALVELAHTAGLHLAQSALQDGSAADGSLYTEGSLSGPQDLSRSWWAQAEALVGFYNAYQLSGESDFAQAAGRVWKFIQVHLVDREYGDWYKLLQPDGSPDLKIYKAGPWECPYHHSRACLEMLARLEENE